ncbi:hypothetical protein N7499_012293 [Penicillium canescens]|nr:hypothetical protein N7444_002113 [Penicillium canescens]KAJ6063613.1 hypothetical protein N7499_012293 [Penicillium canescens]
MEKIAVDPDFYSIATGFGTDPQDFQSETTSIASSIARGRLENGRRYQATKEDDYWGPSDEQQFEAFEIGYRPRRGYFPPPVSWMPPNCVFEVDDVLREWTWRDSFDFIHMRLMYGAFPPEGWDQLYKQAFDALEPGGWIEQMEFDVRVSSDDGTLKKEHQLWKWGPMFIRCAERAGRSLNIHETMRGAIEKAGFVDVHEEKYKIPLGPWPKDKLLKEVGHLQDAHWNAALEGWAMWLLTHFGEPEPWTKEEVQVFLAKVRIELKDPYIHAYNPAHRVWARKPTLDELEAKEATFKAETSP